MTGNEYQDLAARTINKGLTFEEQKFHAHDIIQAPSFSCAIFSDKPK